MRILDPVLAVDVAHHGRDDGDIRDPIIKSFRPARYLMADGTTVRSTAALA